MKEERGKGRATHLLVRDRRSNTHRRLRLVDECIELRSVRVVALEGIDLLVVAFGGADAELGGVVRVDEAELVAVGVDLELGAT
jgi:hypothetical protein